MRVAIIALHVLHALALKDILRRHPGISVETFADMSSMASSSTDFDIYMLDAATYLSNLQFFLPRKSRCLVVFDNKTSRYTANIKAPDTADTFQSIYADTDDTEIETRISSLINVCKKDDAPSAELSQREKEVLRELASGLTNKEIADRLCISANTVITHRKNISAKLGIKSASGLSLFALMNGII
ncbi:MAG: LuxR C-terminal-related transcriptional regulator [Muribaculum sp.]|nr:LuxR C-terminal-related transcriptional regulator [Muribaculum sp.]